MPIAAARCIVENKAGAGGNIATEYTARSKPDGHTIFVHAGTTLASNYHLIKNKPVDVGKQIQVAATINRQPFMLVVDDAKPVKTVAELTASSSRRARRRLTPRRADSGLIMCAIYKERPASSRWK